MRSPQCPYSLGGRRWRSRSNPEILQVKFGAFVNTPWIDAARPTGVGGNILLIP